MSKADASLIMKAHDVDYFGATGYASISSTSFASLGLQFKADHRQIVAIYGKDGRALARCNMFALFSDRLAAEEYKTGQKIIWLDPVVRTNAGAGDGEYVIVKQASPLRYADLIELDPVQVEVEVTAEQLSGHFAYIPIIQGNVIIYDREENGELRGALYRITKTVPKWDNGLVIRPDCKTEFKILQKG